MNETRTVQKRNDYSDGITLWRLLKAMGNHVFLIIAMAVLMAVASFGVAEFAISPQYTASAQILVNQKHATADGQAFNNQQADIQMINTYKGIITNHQILHATQKQLAKPNKAGAPAYKLSYKQLKKMVSVQTSQNSQLFELKAKAPSAKEASTVANTVTTVFQKRIKKIMGFNNVKVTSYAVTPTKPTFPSVKLFTVGGAVVGLFLGTVIAVIKEVN